MIGLIGKKIGMTQLFDEIGALIPVTVLQFEDNVVIRKREAKVDGYEAVALGSIDLKPNKVSAPLKGQFPSGLSPKRIVREFRGNQESLDVGNVVKVSVFDDVKFVDVVGISKGKGFAGAIKRHGFGGGRETHGSKFHRGLGSTGQSATPSHTKPGQKMAGRMGRERITTQNLRVFQINMELGLIIVKGAVPGANNSFVIVKQAVKRK